MIKCTCSQCTHIFHHNYPEGESRIILTLNANQNHIVDGPDAYHISTLVFSNTDIFTNEESNDEVCNLEVYFSELCKKYGLPIPSFTKLTPSNKTNETNETNEINEINEQQDNKKEVRQCLWYKLGHRQKKDENDLNDKCWRNEIARLSYKTQVERLYKGLIHELICTLDSQDIRPISFVKKKNPQFEDWFHFYNISLDMHE